MLHELEKFCRQRQELFYPKADLVIADYVLRTLANPSAQHSSAYEEATVAICGHVLREPPLNVAPLSESGTFHVLYRATLRDGRRVIVRLNALGDVQRDFLLHLDPWVMGRLRAARLPALQIHKVDISRTLCPFDWELLEEARGRPLKAFDDREPLVQPLLFQLGRFVGRLHQIGTLGHGFFDIRPLVQGESETAVRGIDSTWSAYVLRRLDDHLQVCAAAGAISRDEMRRIRRLFTATSWLDDVEPVLLHGDLGSHNVFTDGQHITALIDWEDCLSGDPLFDVAFWATFHPDRRHEAFLDGYRSVRSLPWDFERRFWLYYLRVALSKTVLRQRLKVADQPDRPAASGRIQKALERLESLRRPAAA
jgi:aminoglycoside phosphotransferase (APT) family kinase protein